MLQLLLSHVSHVQLCNPIDGSPPGSRPWNSPGKNTGVGCHFLLQCMKVKSESEAAQSCLILSDPLDCSLPGSAVHGISQARVLVWVAIAFSPKTYGTITNRLTRISLESQKKGRRRREKRQGKDHERVGAQIIAGLEESIQRNNR